MWSFKAAKQIKEKQALDAGEIAKSLSKDPTVGKTDVFLDDVVFTGATKVKHKMDLKETSLGGSRKTEGHFRERLSNLGLDFTQEDIKTMSRENLFEDEKC